MTKDEIERLARAFFDAIESGDFGKIRDTYASDAVIWHNFDGKESTRQENLATLDGFIKAVPTRRYTQRRLDVFDAASSSATVSSENSPTAKKWASTLALSARSETAALPGSTNISTPRRSPSGGNDSHVLTRRAHRKTPPLPTGFSKLVTLLEARLPLCPAFAPDAHARHCLAIFRFDCGRRLA